MAVNLVGSASAALRQAAGNEAISVAVLKKAMALQEQGAMQLLQTLPALPSNPPHLGNRVDTYA